MKIKKIFPLLLFALLIACFLVSIASSRATNYEATLKNKIDVELEKGAQIVITASRSSTSTTTIITGTVTNTSSSTLQDLIINGMTIKDRGETGFRYSVLDIFEEDKVEISSLAPDASINFTFILENINWEANNIHGVIFVQEVNSEKKEVLQALYIQ
jgi:diaminopimelate epimerase